MIKEIIENLLTAFLARVLKSTLYLMLIFNNDFFRNGIANITKYCITYIKFG